jgi:hypothetical protein
MLAGETRVFSAMDNLFRVPSHAAWTIDNATTATLSTTPAITLTAVSVGDVTLTATWQGLTATTHVTVLGVSSAPAGTPLWTAPPMNGAVENIVQGAVTLDNRRQVYALERTVGSGDAIRAFDIDGRSLWATSVPGRVDQLSGDPFGGVVALYGTTILQLTPDGNGSIVAEDASRGFAIDARANVYFDNGVSLVGGGASIPLPQPDDTAGYTIGGIPTVLEDGRVAVPALVTGSIFGSTPNKVKLMVYTPGGGIETHTVASYTNGGGLGSDSIWPYKAVPNGRGDILVLWDDLGNSGSNYYIHAVVGTVHGDGTGSDVVAFVGDTWGGFGNYPLGDLVVAEDRIIATAYNMPNIPGSVGSGNAATVSQLSPGGNFLLSSDAIPALPNEIPKLPTFLAVAGGVVVSAADGRMSGPDAAFDRMHLAQGQYLNTGGWLGRVNSALAIEAGPTVSEISSWSASRGGQQVANRATRPGMGIFLKAHDVVGVALHSSIRIVPHDPSWRSEQSTIFNYQNAFGDYFATIGAGPPVPDEDTVISCTAYSLVSNVDRGKDTRDPPAVPLVRLEYSPLLENRIISLLFWLDSNYQDSLPYCFDPSLLPRTYNSNSYAAGLLDAASVRVPLFPERYRYVGWNKPVPRREFFPH